MVHKAAVVLAVVFFALTSAWLTGVAQAEPGKQDLCVQLKWSHQSQFAGLYVAQKKGFYLDAGLAVRFQEGGPATNWIERMSDRSCPVGIANAHDLVIASENGVPVVAVAAINQVSPIVFFTLAERGIHSPREFPGKTVALLQNALLQFYGVLKRVGVDPTTVRHVPFSVDMSRLYNGEVDIWSGYHTNLVSMAEEQGHKVNVIFPLDYGVQVYDDIIYVHEDLIAQSPEAVLGFLRASFKGWVEAIKDPSSAVDYTLEYVPSSVRAHEELLLRRTIPYIHTGEFPVGWMEPSVWAYIVSLTHEVGLTEHKVDPQTVYTTRFLSEIYGRKAQ